MSNRFFIIPNSLVDDDEWINLPLICQNVYLAILRRACYKKTKYNVFGVIVELQPGEICCTYEQLASWCHKSIDKKVAERAVKKLIFQGFLSQNLSHKLSRKKTILTVSRLDVYNACYNRNVPENVPENVAEVSQKCPTNINSKTYKQDVVVVASEKNTLHEKVVNMSEVSNQIQLDDVYYINLKNNLGWEPEEIEEAWKIYCGNKENVSDPIRYIEGTINNKRVLKRTQENKTWKKQTKKTIQKARYHPKESEKKTNEKSKSYVLSSGSSLVDDTKMHASAKSAKI